MKSINIVKKANEERFLVIQVNNSVLKFNNKFSQKNSIKFGDAILVSEEMETRNIFLWKNLIQILYQIAIGVAIVLRF